MDFGALGLSTPHKLEGGIKTFLAWHTVCMMIYDITHDIMSDVMDQPVENPSKIPLVWRPTPNLERLLCVLKTAAL